MKQALVLLAAFVGVACGGTAVGDPNLGSASTALGTGDPCTMDVENDPRFLGFDEKEVVIENRSAQCRTGVCIANHFRGRVSCPYGQSAAGSGPAGGSGPCLTTDGSRPVTGEAGASKGALVAPQCRDRKADAAVYCSCRCANADGRTDDGGNYCPCGAGFACTSLVTSIGARADDLSGSYCLKVGTVYDRDTACSQGDCDPLSATCP